MASHTLYYATNRNHIGKDRWKPSAYGTRFSADGIENLRFGKVTLDASETRVDKFLGAAAHRDVGDGEGLSEYLAGRVGAATIEAYPEVLDPASSENVQPDKKLGSAAMFADLRADMRKSSDVVIFVHGFNVPWSSAVGTALALQRMLNRPGVGDPDQSVLVVLFSWPSDGMALPFVSYKSDRTEAQGSGYAVGRGILKLRDFLAGMSDRPASGGADPNQACEQDIHLLCHSMGNYVLQSALARVQQMQAGAGLPRIFEHIFMCAPDVDDGALEPDQALGALNRLCRNVTVYHNRGDVAMYVSDYTKGNPERLGTNGPARPSLMHNKVHVVDCTPIVKGIVEHSYYLWGPLATDVRLSIDGVAFDGPGRTRTRSANLSTVWTMT